MVEMWLLNGWNANATEGKAIGKMNETQII